RIDEERDSRGRNGAGEGSRNCRRPRQGTAREAGSRRLPGLGLERVPIQARWEAVGRFFGFQRFEYRRIGIATSCKKTAIEVASAFCLRAKTPRAGRSRRNPKLLRIA